MENPIGNRYWNRFYFADGIFLSYLAGRYIAYMKDWVDFLYSMVPAVTLINGCAILSMKWKYRIWQITAKYFDIESYKRKKCYIIIDKGFTDQVKGKAKENVGDITGDKSTKSEGLLDQAVGKVKEVVADVKDVIDEVTDKAKEKMNKE